MTTFLGNFIYGKGHVTQWKGTMHPSALQNIHKLRHGMGLCSKVGGQAKWCQDFVLTDLVLSTHQCPRSCTDGQWGYVIHILSLEGSKKIHVQILLHMSSTRLHYRTRLHLLTWAPLCLRGSADWSLYVHILFDQKFTPDVIRNSGVKAKHFKHPQWDPTQWYCLGPPCL